VVVVFQTISFKDAPVTDNAKDNIVTYKGEWVDDDNTYTIPYEMQPITFIDGEAEGAEKRAADAPQVPMIWDLTGGPDQGLGGGFDIVDDVRTPPWVFRFEYKNGNRVRVGNVEFSVPDGVQVAAVNQFKGVSETKLTNTWTDYWTHQTKSLSFDAGAKFEGVELKFKYEGTKGYIKKLTNNGTKSFGWNGGTYLTFALNLRNPLTRPPLDPDFAGNIKLLTPAYNPSLYGRFIRGWGTHFLTRAIYGCEYNFTAALDNKFTEGSKAAWATKNIDLTLKYKEFDAHVNSAKCVNKSSIDGSIYNATVVTANARGGNVLKFVVGKDFDGWVASCETMKMPIIRYSDIEPITNLIADPVKRANVARAIREYGASGKLQLKP